MDIKALNAIPDILTLWEKLVDEDPNAVVIVDGADASNVFTRKTVDRHSAQVRAWLKQQSIGREDMVMISLPRGALGMIAILGVWKAGAAFILTEANYPKDRISYIKENANVKAVIDTDTWMEITELEPEYGHDTPDIHDAAFAIYTSGSTGKPKGVLHEYGTLKMNQACGIGKNMFDLSSRFHIAHIVPFSFVASIKIALVSFTAGVVMYILPYEVIKNPIRLKMYFLDNEINCAFLSPSILRSIGKDFGPYVKVLVLGSEPAGGIAPSSDAIFINTYAMSESAFTITEFVIDKEYDICPVGTPNIPWLGLTLLNEEGQEVSAGEEGEICFHNPFFRGYIGLPEETAMVKKDGLFHSGDRGRFDEEGQLILTGRTNDMIKINGNRVEPSEIEAVAKNFLPINQCIVKGFVDAKRSFLCLYYTADTEIDIPAAREALAEELPYYMIPSYYIRMDAMPLLPNGKVNKGALKAPEAGKAGSYVPPRNGVEKRICSAMEKVLGIEKVGIYDDFYDIGGDSLSSMNVLAETGIEDLNAMDIFKGRTPEKIAAIYDEYQRNKPEISPEEFEENARKRPLPLTVVQTDIFDRQLYNPKEAMWNLPQMYCTEDLSQAEKFKDVLNQVVQHHPVFSMIIEFGDEDLPVQRYDKSLCPVIEIEEMSEEAFQAQRLSMVGLHRLMGHPLFEIRLIRTEVRVYVFFNPHHIMIDGMGYQALFTNIARAYRGEELIPDTFCSFLAEVQASRESMKFYEDKEFIDQLYGGKNWTRYLFPDIGSTDNLMALMPFPIQVPVEDAEKFESISKLSRNGLFSLAAMMAISKCTEKDDIMIAWAFHNRTNASQMRAVGLLSKALPLGISFSEYDTMAELYEEMKTQSALVLEHSSYEYTYTVDNVFEADSLAVVYEIAAVADQGTLSDIGLVTGQEAAEVVSTNKVALQNLCMLVYEFADSIQPVIIYSKSLYSEELMERYSDAFVEYLKRIIAVTDPANTKVSDLIQISGRKEETSGLSPDTKVKDLAREYPWMEEKLGEEFPEAQKYTSNRVTRSVIMGMNLGTISKYLDISCEELCERIDKMIAKGA